MNILGMGDLHHRATAPRSRKDEYVKTLMGKVDQIHAIAAEYKCQAILQPGDFFDSSMPPLWLLSEVIRKHQMAQWLVVLGNHDQRYHTNSKENTAVGVLEAAGVVTVLSSKRWCLMDERHNTHAYIYGVSWGGEIPVPPVGDVPNVLVLHRMVIGNKKLWEQQQDFAYSQHLLRKHKFDLILSGDNHQFFVDEYQGRYLANCGSLMRANSDQAQHEPSVVVYNTGTRKLKVVKLKVEPASEVLSTEEADIQRERNKDLEAFIEYLATTSKGDAGLDFLAYVDRLASQVSARVREKVDGIVKEADGN